MLSAPDIGPRGEIRRKEVSGLIARQKTGMVIADTGTFSSFIYFDTIHTKLHIVSFIALTNNTYNMERLKELYGRIL
jgi:hypothetical protein